MKDNIKMYIVWGLSFYFIAGIVFFIVSGLFNIKYTTVFNVIFSIIIFSVLMVWIYDAKKDELVPWIMAASGFAGIIILGLIAKFIVGAMTENGSYLDGLSEIVYLYQCDGEMGFFKKLLYGVLLGGTVNYKPNLLSVALSIGLYYAKNFIASKKSSE